jgi:hypothetical protein
MARTRSRQPAERFLDLYQRFDLEFKQEVGGYPDDVDIVCGHVVIASADDNGEAQLRIFTPEDISSILEDYDRLYGESPGAPERDIWLEAQ